MYIDTYVSYVSIHFILRNLAWWDDTPPNDVFFAWPRQEVPPPTSPVESPHDRHGTVGFEGLAMAFELAVFIGGC